MNYFEYEVSTDDEMCCNDYSSFDKLCLSLTYLIDVEDIVDEA